MEANSNPFRNQGRAVATHGDLSPRFSRRSRTVLRLVYAATIAICCGSTESHAQTFTTLKSFGNLSNMTGRNTRAPLIQGPDGTLYGTTPSAEGFFQGTVFRINMDGTGFALLKYFPPTSYNPVTDGYSNSDGAIPVGAVVLSGNGLYGTTSSGGSAGAGTVFSVNTDGSGFMVLKNFGDAYGAAWRPAAGLTLSDNTLFGTTDQGGGGAGNGTVFKINTDGTGYQVLKAFSAALSAGINTDGAHPRAALLLSGNTLYGTTEAGGATGLGTMFRINTDGSGFSVILNLGFDSAVVNGRLQLAGSSIYGTTQGGGADAGRVFRVNTDGSGYTVLKSFSTGSDGAYPIGGVLLSGSTLYGTTGFGGTGGAGNVFKMNTNGTGFTVLKSFGFGESGNPAAGLLLSGSTLYGTTPSGGYPGGTWNEGGYGTIFKVNTNGTGFAVLKTFSDSDAARPQAGLVLSGNTLYGTTSRGGSNSVGTVFKVNTDGSGYTVIENFVPLDLGFNSSGAFPAAALVLSGNMLYGTTQQGGSFDGGTLFKLNTDGTGFAVIRNFGPNGEFSPGGRLLLSGGILYGTTYYSGSYGTVFKVNTNGSGFTILKNFAGGADGEEPHAGLVLSDSTLYGTTHSSSGYGTVFKLTVDGSGFTVLKKFAGTDGARPSGDLVLSGGTLFGTTEDGVAGNGTIFKINTDGTGFVVLKYFSATDARYKTNTDGAHPLSGLVVSGSTLYGTTTAGGILGSGTAFQINMDGSNFKVLKQFSRSDGAAPSAGPVVSGGTLYGTTAAGGGSFDEGTVFKIELGNPLTWQLANNAIVLSWNDPTLALQTASELTSTYTNIPNATSPYTNSLADPQRFFRLKAK